MPRGKNDLIIHENEIYTPHGKVSISTVEFVNPVNALKARPPKLEPRIQELLGVN